VFAVVTKCAVLNVPFKANSGACALNSCLYSVQFLSYNAQFLAIQHSIPLHTTLNSFLYNAQFLSIEHSIPRYTTLNFCLYNTQFLSIQHSISVYTTLNISLCNTQFLSTQHSDPAYKTLNSLTLSEHNQKVFTLHFKFYCSKFCRRSALNIERSRSFFPFIGIV
jgi:hypothetical protein